MLDTEFHVPQAVVSALRNNFFDQWVGAVLPTRQVHHQAGTRAAQNATEKLGPGTLPARVVTAALARQLVS